MNLQIFLIAPLDADASRFPVQLHDAVKTTPVAVKAVTPIAQQAGAAVLIEGEPGLVRTLGVDGLHVEGSVAAVKAAVAALKPDYIVGAGAVQSRHDAMSKGELGPDYVMFGPLSGTRDPQQREMARWWSEVMEVPAVYSNPVTDVAAATSEGCEFIGIGGNVWTDPRGPGAALTEVAEALKVPA
jgi:thiamine-phosphate pyrophosphorylase